MLKCIDLTPILPPLGIPDGAYFRSENPILLLPPDAFG